MTTFQKIIKYSAIALAAFIIVNIAFGMMALLLRFSTFLNLKSDNSEEIITSQSIVNNIEDVSKIETLKIELKQATLIIKTGQSFNIQTSDDSIQFEKNDEDIVIKEKDYDWFSTNNNRELIIYIPEDLAFETVKISTGAGKIEIEKLTTKNLSFEIGAGDAKINDLFVTGNAKIEGGAGKVTISNGTINNLDLDMGVGKVELTGILTGNNKIEAGIGKLEINLTDNKDNYTINADKGIGSISVDGTSISDDENYGTGINYIKVDGGIGATEINFK